MNKKQLIYIVVAAVIVVLAGMAVVRKGQESWQAGDALGTKVLPDFAVNDIEKVVITDEQREVTLRKKNNIWVVAQRHDYPAKFEILRNFLRNLHDLKVTQTPAAGESQYGRLQLLMPGEGQESGMLVQFFDADGAEVGEIILGKLHEKKSGSAMGGSWPDGRYIRIPGRQGVVLVAETFSSVKTNPTDWLQDEFFKIGDIQQAQLSREGETVWTLSRETKAGSLQLENMPADRELDDTKVRQVRNAFSWASFEDVAAPGLTPAETGLDEPAVFTARDFDGLVYNISIGNKTGADNYYLAVQAEYDGPAERQATDDETAEDMERKDAEFAEKQEEHRQRVAELNQRLSNWVYLVRGSSVNEVLKDVEDLLKEKPVEEAAADEDEPTAEPGAEPMQADAPAVENEG